MKEANVPQFEKKLFYRINEVSKITGIEDYVLRYWESEFTQFCPQKGKNKTRLYKQEDIMLIFKIKKLLKEEKFTIQGAKEYLKKEALEEKKKNEVKSEEPEKLAIPENKIFKIRHKIGIVKKEIAALLGVL